MKKLSSMIFAACLCSAGVQAQQAFTGNDYKNALVAKIISSKAAPHQNKTTAIEERLIGTSIYGWDNSILPPAWIRTDTAKYTWSSGRTSHFDYNFMTYSRLYNPSPSLPIGFIYTYTTNLPGFYTLNNRPLMAPDKVVIESLDPSTSLFTSTFTYNDSGDVLSLIDTCYPSCPTIFAPSLNNIYNSAGALTAAYYCTDATFTDTTYARFMSYNTVNQVTLDSVTERLSSGWRSYRNFTYEYDGAGNVALVIEYNTTSGTPVLTSSFEFTYDTDNKLTKIISTSGYEVGTPSSLIDSFGWSTSYPYIVYDSQHAGSLSGYTSVSTKYVSATTGKPDSVLSYRYNALGSLTSRLKDVWTYDSYLEPIRQRRYRYQATTMAYDSLLMEVNYYYDTITSTNVGSTMANSGMMVYPNPANTVLYMEPGTEWMQDNISANLYTITGQLALKYAPNSKQLPLQLDLSQLPAGTYLLEMHGTGNRTYRQTVMKL